MERKTYKKPELSEIGSIHEAVHADRVTFIEDGTVVKGDMVLVHLTKSE